MAVRLSGRDTNSSHPRILLPAALFPDPDLPSSTRRSSGADEEEDEDEERLEAGDVEVDEEEEKRNAEGEPAKVGEECEGEKTGE